MFRVVIPHRESGAGRGGGRLELGDPGVYL